MGTPTEQAKAVLEWFGRHASEDWDLAYNGLEQLQAGRSSDAMEACADGSNYLAYFGTQIAKYIAERHEGTCHAYASKKAKIIGQHWRRLMEGGPEKVASAFILGLEAVVVKMLAPRIPITELNLAECFKLADDWSMINEYNQLHAIASRCIFLASFLANVDMHHVTLREAMEAGFQQAKRVSNFLNTPTVEDNTDAYDT